MRKNAFTALITLILLALARPVFASGTWNILGGFPMLDEGRADIQNAWMRMQDTITTSADAAWLGRVIEFFGLLLIAAFFIGVLRPLALHTMDVMEKKMGRNLGMGALGLVGIPVFCAVLSLTLIGIPLVLVLLAVWVALICLALVVAGWYIGRLILHHLLPKRVITPFWEAVFGMTIFIVVFDWLPALFSGIAGQVFSGIAVAVQVVFILWAAGAVMYAVRAVYTKGNA